MIPLLVPELVLSVIRAISMHQIQPQLREPAKVMERGLEVLSFVVRFKICDAQVYTLVFNVSIIC